MNDTPPSSPSHGAYGTLTEPATLRIQRLLPGPIERCWAWLTDANLRRRWLADGAWTCAWEPPSSSPGATTS